MYVLVFTLKTLAIPKSTTFSTSKLELTHSEKSICELNFFYFFPPEFLTICIKRVLSLYKHVRPRPQSVVLIGHSMVGKGIPTNAVFLFMCDAGVFPTLGWCDCKRSVRGPGV